MINIFLSISLWIFCFSTLVYGQETGLCEFPCTWRQLGNLSVYPLSYGIVENQSPDAVIEHLLNVNFPADSPSEMRVYGKDNSLVASEECVEIVDQFIIIKRQGSDVYRCLQIIGVPTDELTIQWTSKSTRRSSTDKCFLCHSPNAVWLLRAEIDQTQAPTITDFSTVACDTPRVCPDCDLCDVCTDAESGSLDRECQAVPNTVIPGLGPKSKKNKKNKNKKNRNKKDKKEKI